MPQYHEKIVVGDAFFACNLTKRDTELGSAYLIAVLILRSLFLYPQFKLNSVF